jgi:UDPglucose 6-dehydrogenase
VHVCVYGLWHLGAVTAACLAEHFVTVGCDPDPLTISRLRAGQPPVSEPGLAELLQAGLSRGRLSFTGDLALAAQGADVVWVAFDTPVDEEDAADVPFVERRVADLFPHLGGGTVVLISSQVPVGFTGRTEAAFRAAFPGRAVRFAYSPENLRLGKALDAFRNPQRIVVGARGEADRARLGALLAPFCTRIECMSVESAEMTKHALNAYLATSVSFINEVARLCERCGADAKDVERGLKSDPRIGPRAYLSPGPAFAGGTLARDVRFLERLGAEGDVSTPLLSAVLESNAEQTQWLRRKIAEIVGQLRDARIGVLGLAYKPGTDTLRRSSALELCAWLVDRGAHVRAHDPAVRALPPESRARIELVASPAEVFAGAEMAVVATPWPEYRRISPDEVAAAMKTPRVIDQSRFLADTLGADSRIQYVAVGTPGGRLAGC